MNRDVVLTIPNCPINGFIVLEDCRECPCHQKYYESLQIIVCDKLSLVEEKMAAEPSRIGEPVSKW